MTPIAWSEELSVKHPRIDDDHRAIFALLGRLHADMRSGALSEHTQTIVDELADYAAGHFQREEDLMRSIDYPHLDAHRAEHARFLSELGAMQSRIARGAQTLALDVDQFLSSWLRQHVLRLDKELADFLRAEQGVC